MNHLFLKLRKGIKTIKYCNYRLEEHDIYTASKAWYPLDSVKLNTPMLSLNTCMLSLTPPLVDTCGVKASSVVLRISKS